jgi:hypothetical protein
MTPRLLYAAPVQGDDVVSQAPGTSREAVETALIAFDPPDAALKRRY